LARNSVTISGVGVVPMGVAKLAADQTSVAGEINQNISKVAGSSGINIFSQGGDKLIAVRTSYVKMRDY